MKETNVSRQTVNKSDSLSLSLASMTPSLCNLMRTHKRVNQTDIIHLRAATASSPPPQFFLVSAFLFTSFPESTSLKTSAFLNLGDSTFFQISLYLSFCLIKNSAVDLLLLYSNFACFKSCIFVCPTAIRVLPKKRIVHCSAFCAASHFLSICLSAYASFLYAKANDIEEQQSERSASESTVRVAFNAV